MVMLAVSSVFAFLAWRGFPWKMLVFAVPLAAFAGLLDAPPNFEYLNVFARDVANVITKAVFVSVLAFALAKFMGRFARRWKKTAPSNSSNRSITVG